MTNQSDTPATDAQTMTAITGLFQRAPLVVMESLSECVGNIQLVSAFFSRKLERERNELRAQVARLEQWQQRARMPLECVSVVGGHSVMMPDGAVEMAQTLLAELTKSADCTT